MDPKPRTTPIRAFGPFDNEYRSSRLRQQAEVSARIAEIDRTFALLSRERAELLEKSRTLQDELYPPSWFLHGRAPEAHSIAEPLPPAPAEAEPVYGRRLRTVCLRILRRVGRLTLRRLHALLHLHGFRIDAANPVKALGDALGHEADAGRAYRVARGTYEPAPGLVIRPKNPDHLDDLVLPYLDLDAGPEVVVAG